MKYVTRDRIGARRTIIKAETFEQIIAELYSFHTERLAEYPWIYPKNPDRFSEICYDHADRDPKTRVVTGFTQRPDDRLPFIILMHHFHWNEGARTAYTVGYGIPESRGRKPYLARFQEPWELIPWLQTQTGVGNNWAVRVAIANGDILGVEDMEVIGEQHERFKDTIPD